MAVPWHTSPSSQPVLYGGHVRLGSYFHKRSFGAISFVNLLGAAATATASQNRFIAHFILLLCCTAGKCSIVHLRV